MQMKDKRLEIDAVAMAAAMRYELSRGWVATDVSSGAHSDEARAAVRALAPELRQISFAIFSVEPKTKHVRFIEVKGRSTSGPVEINEKERLTALGLRADYWLYVVFDCRSEPRVLSIQNPMRLHWEPYPGNQYRSSPSEYRYTLSSEQIITAIADP